ncbi:MAG: DUF2207 domain-containing protein, partial [Woeseiales bacterium]
LLLFVCLVFIGTASADERILSYHSDILVRADGWIEVTETIRVRAEGNQIRRGIYRDYPVRYEDKFGNKVKVQYEPRSVLRNSQREDFHNESNGDDVRTYFGSADRTLSDGEHTYVYRYDAGRMLGYFDEADELYWNVTGHEWEFPIDTASVSLTFEFSPPIREISRDAYVGSFGDTGDQGSVSSITESGGVEFRTARALSRNEGLTIVVSWPKGLVVEPSDRQRLIWLLSDNLNLLVIIAGLIAMLSYYIPVWRNYGKDPDPGVIPTLYEPPEGFSPASLRYIEKMGYDNATMTAAVVNLAVKGYLEIKVSGDKHTLHKTDIEGSPPALATGETELYEALFHGGRHLTLTDDNYERIGLAKSAHQKSLKSDYYKRYFRTNGLLNLPAVIVAIISGVVALVIGPSFGVIATIVLMIVTIVTFAIIMKRPTEPGRQILDQLKGFREFLEIAEKDEMNLRNPPDKTPALFEAYLPFALALGVEQQWSERFTRIFAALKGPNNTDWSPVWYNGSWNNLDLSSNASGLSSGLSSAIGSSVTPPGSSSGSGGGGFSGGGGGGGGGGGW